MTRYGLVHISTGDMLRAAVEKGTKLGRQVKELMDQGSLVPDSLMCGIVHQRLSGEDVIANGFLLDGFPRTLPQAKDLVDIVGEDGIDLALNLHVSEKEVTRRMLARAREDDTPEAIHHRLALYDEETVPVMEWFEDKGLLVTIHAEGETDEVTDRLVAAIDHR